MKKTRKIVLLLNPTRNYTRGLIGGIAKYAHLQEQWVFYRPLDYREPTPSHGLVSILRELKPDGIFMREPKQMEQIIKMGIPTVSFPYTLERIQEIARGLSTFSRVEKAQVAPVDLTHVIEAAINMAYNEIKYRARLVKDFGKTPKVMASDGRLSQVFLNLLINAAHSIEEGNLAANEIRIRTWADK